MYIGLPLKLSFRSLQVYTTEFYPVFSNANNHELFPCAPPPIVKSWIRQCRPTLSTSWHAFGSLQKMAIHKYLATVTAHLGNHPSLHAVILFFGAFGGSFQ